MLHKKFQVYWNFSSEAKIKGFLPYMGMVVILFMGPRHPEQTFVSRLRWFHMKCVFNRARDFTGYV